MAIDEAKLKEVLLESELLSKGQLKKAVEKSQQENKQLEDVLIENDFISAEHLGDVIADLLGFPYINLSTKDIPDNILRIIPELVAKKQLVIAFDKDKDGVKLAMHDPENLEIIRLVCKKTGDEVIPYFTSKKEIKDALFRYRRGLKQEFSNIIKENLHQAEGAKAEDLPIIKIVDTIVDYAYENKASDVHVEPLENKIAVRFRIDGVLHDVIDLPKFIHDSLVTRIKILSKLRTDEHRAAQDGKFQIKFEDETVDIRVSIVPIADGEKVVMRLLAEKSRHFGLEDLGLSSVDLDKVKRNFHKPFGMILATGPTGSGKTTTLYAILTILNTREVNISTIEDPVEYDIEGVNQIQVNTQTNLNFASGLRSILRQDPDIIMVGEIRDEETADIAINSAMTGHLVLSTLHTNDAPTTLPRLLDMGVEPFLIASTINVAIGQRLVRKIHRGCLESYLPTNDQVESIKNIVGDKVAKQLGALEKGVRFYRGKGCKVCNYTGYEGRIGIFEVLEINEDIRKLIMQRSSSDEIKKRAIEHGMTTMLEDGIRKILQGVTTLEEVLRVTRE